jgi:hypothetical protein
VSGFAPHVLIDTDGNELGRCGFGTGYSYNPGDTLGLGPMGFFRVLELRGGDPFVLVVEPVETPTVTSN